MANSIAGIGGSSSSQPVDIAETSRAAKQGVQESSTNPNDPVASTPGGDATELSNLGSFIATAAKLAGAQGSIRPAVVAALKGQIAAGAYRPDLDQVAARVAAALKS